MIEWFPAREIMVTAGPIVIRWYGVFYVIAFAVGWRIWPYFLKRRGLSLGIDDRLFLFTSALAGLMIGGRLGYALLYTPQYFLSRPLEIFALWQGGMSSHGGIVGIALGVWWATRSLHLPLLAVLDSLIVPASFGLALGRIGNFINQELYGTITTLPWGVNVKNVEGVRHPVQLYAAAKDLLIASVAWVFLRKWQQIPAGIITALFLVSYGVLRFVVEFVREPEYPLLHIGTILLSRGQLLSLPLMGVGMGLGLYIWYRGAPKTPSVSSPSRRTIH